MISDAASARVLFLCTGNYYRSRHAEIYFNWHAQRVGLAWRADSRGLALLPQNNPGPLSRHTRKRLEELGIPLPPAVRAPRDLEETDMRGAQQIVALKEAEHRPLLQFRFPHWVDRVTYWHVDDLDCAGPETSLPQVESLVAQLVDSLRDPG